MSFNHVILNVVPGSKFCMLQDIENLPPDLRATQGGLFEPWPADVRFHMDPNSPKQIQLPDWVDNLHNFIVVSKPLKDFIAESKPVDVQYLPVTIVDHKGKVASTDYVVINPYSLQDAIDQQASVIDWNPIDPTLIAACTTMVLDESRIAPGASIFRLKHYPSKVLLSRELASGIKKAGFTGVKFIEVEDLEY